MRRVNKLPLVISFIAVIVAGSTLSISAAAENLRWTLEAINPWNGVESVAFVVSYILNTGGFIAYTIAIGLFSILLWGFYMLIARLMR